MKKLILVTGATGGIGKNYSREMLKKGYQVVITYRNKEAGTNLESRLKEEFLNGEIDAMYVDLSDISSIKSFAEEFLKRYTRLDVLVNNAGVYFFDKEKKLSKDDIELNAAIHVVAPFVLTGLLMPLLESTPNSKVISMSSTEHKSAEINLDDLLLEKTFDKVGNMKAYAITKYEVLVFTAELDRRLKNNGKNIEALAVHPGVSITGIQHKGNPSFVQKIMIGIMGKLLAGTPEDAAKPLVLATMEGKSGQYYGPTGVKEAKGKPGLVKPEPGTLDKELGNKLWKELEKITQISYL